ncbi:MAG: hypothetical protein LH624_13945, partial [Cryobacterium sp.]|nr:hypothetical protein [Cryobacterium sp.]
MALLSGAMLTSSTVIDAATVDGQYDGNGTVAAGSTTMLRVAGRGGVPTNARAVSINLTANNPDAAGYATVYPCGEARPDASNLNFTPG